MTRNTIQKSLVLESVRSMTNHPTADEVYAKVSATCPSISKGTVYRNLNVLSESGEIRRVQVANAPDRYDFTTAQHAHFKCSNCGRVYDYFLTNPVMPEDALNLGMTVDNIELVFTGICKICNQNLAFQNEKR